MTTPCDNCKMITYAFTCTGPYAVLIMLGIKRVENRSACPAPAKGRCAVGCSKSFCKEEYGNFLQWAAHALPEEEFERIPAWGDVKEWPGKIVGACDYEMRGLVSLGDKTGTTVVDPGEVFGEALKAGARSIVVAHNHPSGDLTPSRADIATTKKLREAGSMLGVSLLDHLILGSDSKFAIVNSAKG